MIKIENANIATIALEYNNRLKTLKFRDKKFANLFSDNIDDLVLCTPNNFMSKALYYDKEIRNFNNEFKEKFKVYMIGQYERVIYDEGFGVWLTDKLGVNVCPYCNRQYTFTINRVTKSIRPQLDHFYPKSRYPYFALSFYNLIPCCPECNRIKRDNQLTINPYESGFDNCNFRIKDMKNVILNARDKSKWSIEFENNTVLHDNHIDLLALQELYNCHKDYVEEIVFKAYAFSGDLLSDVNTLLNQAAGMHLDKNTANRIIYGSYISKSEYHKRPLSKLTADILKQLKIL